MVFRKLLIFPGHKYLGPGNKVNAGSPVDADDLIAQQHDWAYENATDKEDVYQADNDAIFAFIIHWIKNKNWHSVVGAVGLGLKHLSEVICGKIFYPKLCRNKV
jgi:hypothetical protein